MLNLHQIRRHEQDLLLAQGIMDIRLLRDEAGIPTLCQQQVLLMTPYLVRVEH